MAERATCSSGWTYSMQSDQFRRIHGTIMVSYTSYIIKYINLLLLNLRICQFSFKNGSLTRERIRNNCANGSWEIFNELLDSTPRGNFGNMGMQRRFG